MNRQTEQKLRRLIRKEIRSMNEMTYTSSEKNYTVNFKNGKVEIMFITYPDMKDYISANMHKLKTVYDTDGIMWAWVGSSEFK